MEVQSLRAIINEGDFNCLEVGSEAVISVKTDDGWEDDHRRFEVDSVVIRERSQLQEDPILFSLAAYETALGREELVSVLENMKKEIINITRIKWLKEDQQ